MKYASLLALAAIGLLLAQAPCAEAKRRRPRAGSSKFKNPVCPSVQRAYCKSTACPKWCSGQETDTARKQCEAACNPCCNAVKPSQKVILLGGDDYVTYDLTNDCFLDNSMAPQCKNFLVKYRGYTWKDDVNPQACAITQKETCDTYCTQECTKAYANVTEVALTDAASGNKTDACIKACGPCCKARSVFTGAEGWEATCSLQGAKVPQCDKFREDYGEVYDAACFPADATALGEDGRRIRMDQLRIGDCVAVMGADGKVTYDDVYLFLKKDAAKLSLSYVTLSVAVAATNATRFLTLSETHYLPVAAPGGGRELKTGAAVTAGDAVWVHDESSGSLLEGVIVAKAPVARVGAFVPMTLSGSIIVDGVAASSYSDWAAARLVPGPLRPLLPAAYSAMLALHRAGYRALDAEAWAALAAQVDLTAAGARRYATAALLAAASK